VAVTTFILPDEQLVHLGAMRKSFVQDKWGRIHFWQLQELARGRRSFWAVALLVGIQYAAALRRSRYRDSAGWVSVTAGVLPGIARPSPKAKRAALAELERAGIVEVRRRGHHAPEVRLLPQKPEEEAP
jgi:hypothetical protein